MYPVCTVGKMAGRIGLADKRKRPPTAVSSYRLVSSTTNSEKGRHTHERQPSHCPHLSRPKASNGCRPFLAQPLIDEAARAGIRPIICRQERTGVNMADGFSRTTNGRPFGVFTMQTGPGGLENALGGAAQAYADAIPLLLLPGGVSTARTQVPAQLRRSGQLSRHHQNGPPTSTKSSASPN